MKQTNPYSASNYVADTGCPLTWMCRCWCASNADEDMRAEAEEYYQRTRSRPVPGKVIGRPAAKVVGRPAGVVVGRPAGQEAYVRRAGEGMKYEREREREGEKVEGERIEGKGEREETGKRGDEGGREGGMKEGVEEVVKD